MIYTGKWESVGDPEDLTERQAVPDGWIVRTRVTGSFEGFSGERPSFVGVAMVVVVDKGHHWKIEKETA